MPPGGHGFVYRRPKRKLKLRGGARPAMILLEATGSGGADAPQLNSSFTIDAPATVQLFGHDAPQCFSITVSRVVWSLGESFKARK